MRKDLDRAAAEFVGTDPCELAMMINDIRDEIREEADSKRASKNFRIKSLYDRVYAIQRRLAIDFGAMHGWRLSDKDFGIEALRRGMVHGGADWAYAPPRPFFDHSYFYRVDRRAAAIATHPYHCNKAECKKFAVQNGLAVEWPGDYPSWYYPGHSILAVYIGPVGLSAEVQHYTDIAMAGCGCYE